MLSYTNIWPEIDHFKYNRELTWILQAWSGTTLLFLGKVICSWTAKKVETSWILENISTEVDLDETFAQ